MFIIRLILLSQLCCTSKVRRTPYRMFMWQRYRRIYIVSIFNFTVFFFVFRLFCMYTFDFQQLLHAIFRSILTFHKYSYFVARVKLIAFIKIF